MSDDADPKALRAGFRPVWLAALNFLLADVRGALAALWLFAPESAKPESQSQD